MAIVTFHDPILSAAQAALHHALGGHQDPPGSKLSADHPLMQALVRHGSEHAEPSRPPPSEKDQVLDECAKLYLAYVRARFEGNQAQAQQLADELKFSACDPRWVEAATTYEELVHCDADRVSYVALQPGEGIYDLPSTSSGTLTVGVIADWGTGTATALDVLAQLAELAPDVLVHLGDTYYAGTQPENDSNFVKALARGFGDRPVPPTYNTPGNHDYYSGGSGFFWSVAQLGVQTASYFCLRNDHWQLVALDTGYNDRDPFTVDTNTTQLTPDQIAWLAEVMATAGGRRTILLTHHQLYSGVGPVGVSTVGGVATRWGINPLLYEQIQPYFGQIQLWLWGHEHNTVIFDVPAGLPVGRCVGAGAFPMLTQQDPYVTDTSLVGVDGIPVPTMSTRYELGITGAEYNHGFATLTLSADAGTAAYYQVPVGGARSLMLEESIPPPLIAGST